MVVGLTPGGNPTIVSYNASSVKVHNATSSLARFENKKYLIFFENALAFY
jgi:hypothetical protein